MTSSVEPPLKLPFGIFIRKFGMRAKVEDGQLKPLVVVNDDENSGTELPPIPVSNNGNVLNPVLMGAKIKDLRPGKSFRIPMVNPVTSTPQDVQGGTSIIATVSADTIEWSKQEIPCLRIDFKPLGDASLASNFEASTWYRQKDGLVLKQTMKVLNLDLQLIRVDEK